MEVVEMEVVELLPRNEDKPNKIQMTNNVRNTVKIVIDLHSP